MTAWAVLALVSGGCAQEPSCERGVRFLLGLQGPDGEFPREAVTGVFNRSGPLQYDGYRHLFPVWALGAWHTAVLADDRR
jgi:squalene cyclase